MHNTDNKAVNWCSRSFKINDFCCNWKLTYHFLLVINCHLSSISHHFRDIALRTRSKTTAPQFEPHDQGDPLQISESNLAGRVKALGYILVKTAWSYLQPFCHNTLAWQTDRWHTMTIAELLQWSAKNYGIKCDQPQCRVWNLHITSRFADLYMQ